MGMTERVSQERLSVLEAAVERNELEVRRARFDPHRVALSAVHANEWTLQDLRDVLDDLRDARHDLEAARKVLALLTAMAGPFGRFGREWAASMSDEALRAGFEDCVVHLDMATDEARRALRGEP